MFYTIYETTCVINNKKYIGKHITNNLDDSYLGSGLVLNHAIRKYGKENFIRKILFIYDNEFEMNEKEKELITNEIILSKDYYNIALGGYGGAIILKEGHPLYDEVCKKISNAAIARRDEMSSIVKELHKNKKCGMYGKKQSDRQKKLVSEALTGKTHTKEHRDNHLQSLMKTLNSPGYVHPNKGVPKRKINCEHCGRDFDPGNFKRYHGENCKTKLEYEDTL
jgi:hypothetical protein